MGTTTIGTGRRCLKTPALECVSCGTCGRRAGDPVADVGLVERERVARDHFRALRGPSADAAVTAGARERVARDHASSIRRRQYVTTGDGAVTALKGEWALNKVNECGVPLQDEFGDFETFAAYASHASAGRVNILRRQDSRPRSLGETASAVLSATVLCSQWQRNSPDERGIRPQTEFAGDFEAYSAYWRAVARGNVRMVHPSLGVIKA